MVDLPLTSSSASNFRVNSWFRVRSTFSWIALNSVRDDIDFRTEQTDGPDSCVGATVRDTVTLVYAPTALWTMWTLGTAWSLSRSSSIHKNILSFQNGYGFVSHVVYEIPVMPYKHRPFGILLLVCTFRISVIRGITERFLSTVLHGWC
jgi:hypothetical protein